MFFSCLENLLDVAEPDEAQASQIKGHALGAAIDVGHGGKLECLRCHFFGAPMGRHQ